MRLHTFALTAAFAAILAHAIPVSAQTPSQTSDPTPAQTTSGDGTTAVWTAPASSSLSFDDQRGAYGRRGGSHDPTAIRLFGAIDIEQMQAKQSFSSTLGSSTLLGFGGGLEVVDMRGGLFFRAAATSMSKSGTRFAGSDPGAQLKVAMLPVELGVGLRFNGISRAHNITPYVGGGVLLLHYKETTPAGSATDDDTSAWFTGYQVFGGVDLRISPVLSVAPEVQYRSVPNAIGQAGLSELFNETNLGGLTFRFAVGIRLGHR
jgi:opacity protein-like surface antigen